MPKNKVTTLSYFLKRLRDNGYIANKIFADYSDVDPRKWTILVNPTVNALFITCYENKTEFNQVSFEFNDGGQWFPRHLQLDTDSMEVVLRYLLKYGIKPQNIIRYTYGT